MRNSILYNILIKILLFYKLYTTLELLNIKLKLQLKLKRLSNKLYDLLDIVNIVFQKINVQINMKNIFLHIRIDDKIICGKYYDTSLKFNI